ncbi:hypothetical protein MHYP_G00306740 [Metynnis hypsauchen]
MLRALADILRQQGPVPISQYEQENMATVEGSPKESSMKNHYTPIHNKTNHGYHGKDNFRSGQDMHNFISSGFVTLGRGHLKVHLFQKAWGKDSNRRTRGGESEMERGKE